MTKLMKESGIEWVGEIPEGWECKPIKFVSTYNDEVLTENTDSNFEFDYIEIGSVEYGKGIIKTEHLTFSKAPSRARRIVRSNDIIVSTVRTYLKAVAHIPPSKNQFIASTGFVVIRPRKVNPTFLRYAILSHTFISTIEANSVGISYPAINASQVVQFKIPLPNNQDQRRIAEYLEEKCGEIDSVIERTKSSIEEYKMLKQSVITEAVTKGIHPNRKMKDSGIEWIGDVPKDWDVCFAFQVFNQIKKKNTGMIETNLLSLSYGQIIKKNINTTFGLLPESFEGYNIINKDDIVLRLTDLQNDQKSLRVGIAKEKGIITSAYLTIRNTSDSFPKYLYYYLHSYDIAKGFYGMGAGVRQGLNWEELKHLKILTPPTSEQKEIADYLDCKIPEIDTLIEKKEKLISELETYKRSIIYEYVTGKKEVQ